MISRNSTSFKRVAFEGISGLPQLAFLHKLPDPLQSHHWSLASQELAEAKELQLDQLDCTGTLPLSGYFKAQVVAWWVCMKGAEEEVIPQYGSLRNIDFNWGGSGKEPGRSVEPVPRSCEGSRFKRLRSPGLESCRGFEGFGASVFWGFRGSESGCGFEGFGVPGFDGFWRFRRFRRLRVSMGFRRFRDQELQKTCGTKFLPSLGWHNAAGNGGEWSV